MLVSGNAAGQRVGLPWAPQHRSPPWDAPFGVSARLGSHTCCTHAKALGPFHTPVPVPQVFAPRWTLPPHFEAERWPNLCFSMMAFGAGAAWLFLCVGHATPMFTTQRDAAKHGVGAMAAPGGTGPQWGALLWLEQPQVPSSEPSRPTGSCCTAAHKGLGIKP